MQVVGLNKSDEHVQADKDQNKGIDFSEFAKLWEALHGEGEVVTRNN